MAQDGPKMGPKRGEDNGKIRQDNSCPFKPILKPSCHPSCCLLASKATTIPPNINFASFLKASWPKAEQLPAFESNADPKNQHTRTPINQSTSLRSRSGGMRGAIKSAAPEWGAGRVELMDRYDRF